MKKLTLVLLFCVLFTSSSLTAMTYVQAAALGGGAVVEPAPADEHVFPPEYIALVNGDVEFLQRLLALAKGDDWETFDCLLGEHGMVAGDDTYDQIKSLIQGIIDNE